MAQLTDNSAQRAVDVTPSDTLNIPMPSGINRTKGIYVGAAGNVKVKMADGSDATFTAITIGVIHELSVVRVYATGTTATSIVALF